MAKSREEGLNEQAVIAISALMGIAIALVVTIIAETEQGTDPADVVSGFWKQHSRKSVAAILTAGVAGGAASGAAIWASGLGVWSGLAYTVGLVSMPFWAPVLGAVLGVAVAGGAAAAMNSWAGGKDRGQTGRLFMASAASVLGRTPTDEDRKTIGKILSSLGLKSAEVDAVLDVEAQDLHKLAQQAKLNLENAKALLRLIAPFAYSPDGLTVESKQRFRGVYSVLHGASVQTSGIAIDSHGTAVTEPADEVLAEHERGLDDAWTQVDVTAAAVAILAQSVGLGNDAVEAVKAAMTKVMAFDPRASAAERRAATLKILTENVAPVAFAGGLLLAKSAAVEAAMLGGYALLRTVAPGHKVPDLAVGFEKIIEAKEFSATKAGALRKSRAQIDERMDAASKDQTEALIAARKKAAKLAKAS